MANETKLNMTLLLRRAPFDNSCVLKKGEPGYHTGTKEFKVGDGSTPWIDLPFANRTQIETIVNTAIADHAAGYYTKKEIDDLLDALEQAIGKVASDLSAEVTARQEADADLQEAIDTKLATETFNTWTAAHAGADADHAGTATEITAEIGEAEGRVNAKIGTSTDTRDKATVYGAIAAEAYTREQADTAINNKIGNIGTNTTVAARLDAADQAASNAQSAANTAGQAIDTHKDDKNNPHGVTATQLGLGNVENKSVEDIKTDLTGAIAEGNTGFVTGGDVYAADKALDEKISSLETRIGNVTNVMNFRGAVESFTAVENPVEGDVITFSAELKDGDAVVAKAGSEWVYSAGKWVEIGTASASDAAIADLKSRMDAAEGEIDDAQADIIALGTNKLNTSDFNTWKQGHEADHANKQNAITSAINTAKQDAITEAGRLDGELEAKLIGGDTDTEHAKTIKGAKDYAKDYADSLADNYDAAGAAATAEKNAKDYADSQDTALKTAIGGTADDASSKATIAGAKKYAEEKAAAAYQNAKDYADGLADNYDAAGAAADAKAEVIGKSGDAKTADTIYGAKAFATDAANTAEQNAISAVVGTAADEADDDTIKGVRKAFAAADVTTLTSAQTYADTVAANAVKNNINAGNADIVITRPAEGEDKDKTVISHKVYGSGTYTKPDSVNDANFVTGVTIENGHVTGASVKSLAEALAAMEFIFDGGTSAN